MTMLSYPDPSLVPNEIKNVALKYAYTYIVMELLRLKHNEEGTKFRNGEITEVEWKTFLRDWYEPREETVISDLLELRKACRGYVAQYRDKIKLEDIPI